MMRNILNKIIVNILTLSLILARKQQKLTSIFFRLRKIIPSLDDQYSSFKIEGAYLTNKVYNLHSFQINLALEVLSSLEQTKERILVDIGDSSGTHITYLENILDNIKAFSVNMDSEAVTRIRTKGLKAIHSSAEEVHKHPEINRNVDTFLCFETLEHLEDPINFLRNLYEKSECKQLVITVPYLLKSRVGLHQIRNWGKGMPFNPETTHIFELSPDDWKLIFNFSGWKVKKEKVYLQYPNWPLISFLKYLWRYKDFEGFYGVVLEKNPKYIKEYDRFN